MAQNKENMSLSDKTQRKCEKHSNKLVRTSVWTSEKLGGKHEEHGKSLRTNVVLPTTKSPRPCGTRRLVLVKAACFQRSGDKGARTPDLLDAIETLSQLSYIPVGR